jgi:hypothetical protein
MKSISINNGNSFCTVEEALEHISIDIMATYMDDEAREATHLKCAPCSDAEFLAEYLKVAPRDLIIG